MPKVREEYGAFFNIANTSTCALNALTSRVEETNTDSRNGGIVRPKPSLIHIKVNSRGWSEHFISVLLDFILNESRVFVNILCYKSLKSPIRKIKLRLRRFVKSVWFINRIRCGYPCRPNRKPLCIKKPILFIPQIVPLVIYRRLVIRVIWFVINEWDLELNRQLFWGVQFLDKHRGCV